MIKENERAENLNNLAEGLQIQLDYANRHHKEYHGTCSGYQPTALGQPTIDYPSRIIILNIYENGYVTTVNLSKQFERGGSIFERVFAAEKSNAKSLRIGAES